MLCITICRKAVSGQGAIGTILEKLHSRGGVSNFLDVHGTTSVCFRKAFAEDKTGTGADKDSRVSGEIRSRVVGNYVLDYTTYLAESENWGMICFATEKEGASPTQLFKISGNIRGACELICVHSIGRRNDRLRWVGNMDLLPNGVRVVAIDTSPNLVIKKCPGVHLSFRISIPDSPQIHVNTWTVQIVVLLPIRDPPKSSHHERHETWTRPHLDEFEDIVLLWVGF
ncbi:hypothetical protein BS47DRAFT_1362126 [Hydnum rufescens UP504]|uniref:Uncharacterized protein n=1 Tax=Hydnum rufescens UP504 TaxID=1448309 RepID=A0A9P6AXN3_9AGAM|nr:hypothetical protein BS47DRAFT_1362126 [Hydnum rufescens UP504]